MCMAAAYLSATSPFADRLIEQMAMPEDRAAAAKHRRPLRRRQSLAARACLRAVLERETAVQGRRWRIERNENNSPYLSSESCIKPPAVSLAHSADLVCCAISFSGRIGIDIEQVRLDRDTAALAAFAFGPADADEARESPAEFYRIWVQREALIKAAGGELISGASMPELSSISRSNSKLFNGASWKLRCWNLDEGYSAAIAYEEAPDVCEVASFDRMG